ncbi:hypothetical protein [Pannonibacter phragmitetus]|uniref:hypothetical protein n=1 Tax=Pannonibacter phragmitetus TaxID=121719 RepID=UPI003D2EF7EB
MALVLSASPLTYSAAAFELFGVRLWGSSETAAPDAMPYEVVLTLSGGSDDLKEQLEAASVLISESSSPPSGSDGLIARALNDFDRLVAQLYLQGFYGGTVNISLGGQALRSVLERGKFQVRALCRCRLTLPQDRYSPLVTSRFPPVRPVFPIAPRTGASCLGKPPTLQKSLPPNGRS